MPAPPSAIHQFVASAALLSVARSRAYVESARLDLGDPAPGERCWARLASSRTFDAWLIAWGRDSDIPAHDHGDSSAALRLVAGSLIEFSRSPSATRHWVARELTPGKTLEVPSGHIHHVANPGPDIAISLHVYSPPLADLRFHDDVGSRPLVSTGATA